jgi:hypothetical protein
VAAEDALVRASPLLRMVPVGGVTADRSEFRGARFQEDKTDQQVLRETNRELACDGYLDGVKYTVTLIRYRWTGDDGKSVRPSGSAVLGAIGI